MKENLKSSSKSSRIRERGVRIAHVHKEKREKKGKEEGKGKGKKNRTGGEFGFKLFFVGGRGGRRGSEGLFEFLTNIKVFFS